VADLAATVRNAFAEQLAAFRLRLGELQPTVSSADPAYGGHDRAFMVAGAVKAHILADLAGAVARAVADGQTFDAFKKDFRAIVQRRGWHGWTGEGSVAGEEWRMRTIYKTNMRTSYMAGRDAQLVEGGYRWWVYRHSGAAHPRLNHLAWDGVALPPDHPFWATTDAESAVAGGAEVATGLIDTSVVDRALADTDAAIDGYLKDRYVLPLAETPALITDLALAIAIYKLYVYAPNNKIVADYKDAILSLRDIASGVIRLSVAGAEVATTGGSRARMTNRERPMTVHNLKGFI